jgi:beta-phosphoglucomutase-like phosphatase (HAD superfamily)
MNLAAALFDLDGTLLDHDASAAAAIRSWLPAP